MNWPELVLTIGLRYFEDTYPRVGGTCRIHLQDPEDGSSRFLRKSDIHITA